MKHFFWVFYVLIAILVCTGVNLKVAGAQIFSDDIQILSKNVLPIAEDRKHEALISFIKEVLPELDKMLEENKFNLKPGLNKVAHNIVPIQRDFMIFAYNQARIRFNMPFGYWI